MSNVNDSDARRMREMNEAQFRRKADNTKRTEQGRLQKSFNQVMTDRGQKAQAQQADKTAKESPNSQLAKQVLNKVRKKQSQAPHELARRAAMSKAMHGGLSKKANLGAEQLKQAHTGRADELLTKTETETAHVDKVGREEEEREVERTDDKQAEIEKTLERQDPLTAIGDDERRRDPRQNRGQDRGQQERNAQGLGVTKKSGGAAPSAIPPEVLKQIVNAIYKGVSADGRTHMQVTLKGGALDGVRLEVRAQGGKVSCEFSGCSKELGQQLESAKSALARGLSKRGLKLERLAAR